MKMKWIVGVLLMVATAVSAQTFDVNITGEQLFQTQVPDGNYRVSVTFGSKKKAGETTVLAENRRLMAENVMTKKGKTQTVSFVVNKRSKYYTYTDKNGIQQQGVVRIKEREKDFNTWNDSLDLLITGASPAVSRIVIEPAPSVHTLYLCGNSTVTDQPSDPYASWGQMITRWFGDSLALSNHAESGLTARTFIASNRLDQICSTLGKGDFVICEFGHNDEKEHQAGDGAWYHYVYNLKIFVDRVRSKGATIIFCTPTARRFFNDDHLTLKATHGDFPAAMLSVAEREQVPVIDLTGMTKTFFETLGYEDSKRSLVHYPANTFADQPKALEDNTHFNPYGAYEVAKMVVQGLCEIQSPLVNYLRQGWAAFSPAQPDSWQQFRWTFGNRADTSKPDGS